jgi:hypothetical protein
VGDDRVAALKLKDARGVEVVALDHDGPAAKVGFREHDVILQMNGQDVASEEQLRRMLRETPAGRKADFVLSRDGQAVNVQVVLGEHPHMEQAGLPDLQDLNANLAEMKNNLGNIAIPDGAEVMSDNMDLFNGSDVPPGKLFFFGNPSGAQVESMGPQLAKFFGAKDGVGVLVKEVMPDTPAAKAGLKAGDVVVRVNGAAIANHTAWDRVLRDSRGKSVAVEILRDKRPQKLTLAVAGRTQGSLVPQSFEFEMPDVSQLEAQVDPRAMAEVQKAMAEAQAQMSAPEFQQQMEQARVEAEKAAAEWTAEGPALKAEIAKAQAEAQKAANEWKTQQPEVEKQLREAAEKAKQAAEQMRQKLAPMD